MTTRNLTTGKPAKVVLLFTLPLLIGNVFQQMYGIVDAAVVGQTLGLKALAAVGSTAGLAFLLLGFAWGATAGFAIPTAQAFGANDARGVRRSVAAGAYITAGLAIIMTAVAVPIARPMLRFMRTPPDIIDDATIFVTVTFWGIGAILFFNFLSSTIRALGDSRTPLLFLAIASVLNIVLVYLFIVVFGMGVSGAALSTVASQIVSVVLCLWLVQRKMPALHLHREDWKITWAELVEPMRIGLPMGFQSSIIAIGTIVLQYALNDLGSDAVGAYTAAQKVEGLAMAPLAAFGVAIATYTAQNYGAGTYARIRQGVKQTAIMSVSFAIGIALVNIFFGPSIVRVFIGSGQEEVVAMAQTFLILSGTCYSALGLLFVFRNAMQGMGRPLVPTLAGVMELVTRIAAALLLAPPFGFVGVCLAGPLAWIFAMIPVAVSYSRQRRRLLEDEAYLVADPPPAVVNAEDTPGRDGAP